MDEGTIPGYVISPSDSIDDEIGNISGRRKSTRYAYGLEQFNFEWNLIIKLS